MRIRARAFVLRISNRTTTWMGIFERQPSKEQVRDAVVLEMNDLVELTKKGTYLDLLQIIHFMEEPVLDDAAHPITVGGTEVAEYNLREENIWTDN